MAIEDLIKNLSSRDIIIIVVIIVIVTILITNALKINDFHSTTPSSHKARDNFVQNNTQIENLDTAADSKTDVKIVPKGSSQIVKAKVTLYYTEWCGYSKMFMPEWKLIKQQIQSGELNSKVTIEEYDCEISKNICYANNISGYPSITLQKPDGTIVNYPDDYPRKTDLVMTFITKNI